MHVELPDPHPGRCKNFRNIVHSDGSVETLRCLDYEAVEHVCDFPEPTHRPITIEGFTYAPQAPQHWVRP